MLLLRQYRGESRFDIYPKLFAKLQYCHLRPPLWRSMNTRRWKTRKCIVIAIALCHLENTPRHINKNRELKQWGRERGRERYKTIKLITSCGNATTWFICHENKRNVGICCAKSLTGFKLDARYANIMQHSLTWCTNERNMFCPTRWCNMLHSFARALNYKPVHTFNVTLQLHKYIITTHYKVTRYKMK